LDEELQEGVRKLTSEQKRQLGELEIQGAGKAYLIKKMKQMLQVNA
jgi:hypothetical protein